MPFLPQTSKIIPILSLNLVVDPEAFYHMIKSLENLHNVHTYHGIQDIQIVNGNNISISDIGV